MIKVQRGFLILPHTLEAINKIATCTDFAPHYAYEVMKILRSLNEANLKQDAILQAKFKEIAEKDEAGNPVLEVKDNRSYFKFSDDNKKFADIALAEANNFYIELDEHKLHLTQLAPVKLSPNDLSLIEFLIDTTA